MPLNIVGAVHHLYIGDPHSFTGALDMRTLHHLAKDFSRETPLIQYCHFGVNIKLDAGYPESIKDMFDVIVDMSNVGRTFTPDIFVHQCCQRSLHIFSVMRCIKDS